MEKKESVFSDTYVKPQKKRPISITAFKIISCVCLLAAILLGAFVAPVFGLLSLGTVLFLGIAAKINDRYNAKKVFNSIEETRNMDIIGRANGHGLEENIEKPLLNIPKNSVLNDSVSTDTVEKKEENSDNHKEEPENNSDNHKEEPENVNNEKPETNKEKYDNVKEKNEENGQSK